MSFVNFTALVSNLCKLVTNFVEFTLQYLLIRLERLFVHSDTNLSVKFTTYFSQSVEKNYYIYCIGIKDIRDNSLVQYQTFYSMS